MVRISPLAALVLAPLLLARPAAADCAPVSLATLPVSSDGQAVTALLDSGAPASTLTFRAAEQLGLDPEKNGRSHTLDVRGPTDLLSLAAELNDFTPGEPWDKPYNQPRAWEAEVSRSAWQVTAGQFALGAEQVTPAPLRVQKFARDPRLLLLGVDFIAAHRLLIAYSQNRVYFTYLGGPVFRPSPLALAAASP